MPRMRHAHSNDSETVHVKRLPLRTTTALSLLAFTTLAVAWPYTYDQPLSIWWRRVGDTAPTFRGDYFLTLHAGRILAGAQHFGLQRAGAIEEAIAMHRFKADVFRRRLNAPRFADSIDELPNQIRDEDTGAATLELLLEPGLHACLGLKFEEPQMPTGNPPGREWKFAGISGWSKSFDALDSAVVCVVPIWPIALLLLVLPTARALIWCRS